MIPAAQLPGSPCRWFALQREEKGNLRREAEVKLSFYRTLETCPLPTLLPASQKVQPSHSVCLTRLYLGSDLTHRVSTPCTSALKKGHSLCLDQALQRQKGMKATMRSTMEPSTTPTIKYGKSLERATMAPVPRPLCPPLSGGCCWGATVEGGRRPGRPRDFRAVKERDRVRHRQDRAGARAALSRDVCTSVQRTGFSSGFEEALLDARGFPGLKHIAIQMSPLCLLYRSARLLSC